MPKLSVIFVELIDWNKNNLFSIFMYIENQFYIIQHNMKIKTMYLQFMKYTYRVIYWKSYKLNMLFGNYFVL